MGGCRCTYRNCTVKSDGKTHMFHYPVFEKVRCHQWLLNAHRLEFLDLKVSQLKNRVVCQHHFKDENFMNFKKDKLTFDAIPTEDGPYCDSTKYVNLNPESSKLFSVIIEDIENDYNDKKANYSLKYGDFLANLDLMDIEKIDEDNISYKNTYNSVDILTPHKVRDKTGVFSEDGSFLFNISLHDKGERKNIKPPTVAVSPYMSGSNVNSAKSYLKTRSKSKHVSAVSEHNAAVTRVVTNLTPKQQQQQKEKQQIQHEQQHIQKQQLQKEKQQQLQQKIQHQLLQERIQQQQLQQRLQQKQQQQQRLQQQQLHQQQHQARLQQQLQEQQQQQEHLRQQQQEHVRQQQQELLRQQQQELLRQQQQELLRQQQQEHLRQQQDEQLRQQQQELLRQQQQEHLRQQQEEQLRQQQEEQLRQQQQEQLLQQQQEQLLQQQQEQQLQQQPLEYLQQQQQQQNCQQKQLQKKETKVKILSEKKVTDPVAITGKFELVTPNYVLNVSKRRDRLENTHNNNSNPMETKDNGDENKTIEIDISPLSKEDDDPKPEQFITSEKLPLDSYLSENSPKVSVIKSRVPPERVEAINKKREFNMKLRDMVETCLDKLDNYNQTEQTKAPRNIRTKVNKINNQQVKSLPKHTQILNPQEYTIAFLEARIRKMESTLLEKIEQNSMKIIDLKNTFGKSSDQLVLQTKADEETRKKQLFLEIAKYLSPSSKSLIYEELFINKFALNESTTSPKRKRRRRK